MVIGSYNYLLRIIISQSHDAINCIWGEYLILYMCKLFVLRMGIGSYNCLLRIVISQSHDAINCIWGEYLILYICKLFVLIMGIGSYNCLLRIRLRVFANSLGNLGLIPGRVIPKTQKMVLDASLLNLQHYKVLIKSKVEQSRE